MYDYILQRIMQHSKTLNDPKRKLRKLDRYIIIGKLLELRNLIQTVDLTIDKRNELNFTIRLILEGM